MREYSMMELYGVWLHFENQSETLKSVSVRMLASESFNNLIIKIQSECERYGIDYSIENLSGDTVYMTEIMNKINDRYMIEEEIDNFFWKV